MSSTAKRASTGIDARRDGDGLAVFENEIIRSGRLVNHYFPRRPRPYRITEYDTVVVGVGGMGSTTTANLARRGQRVLGLEHFDVPHAKGSSHGVTRIIWKAYYEHPDYVPLLERAYDLWCKLDETHPTRLLHTTGCVIAGPEDGEKGGGAQRLRGTRYRVRTAHRGRGR